MIWYKWVLNSCIWFSAKMQSIKAALCFKPNIFNKPKLLLFSDSKGAVQSWVWFQWLIFMLTTARYFIPESHTLWPAVTAYSICSYALLRFIAYMRSTACTKKEGNQLVSTTGFSTLKIPMKWKPSSHIPIFLFSPPNDEGGGYHTNNCSHVF